MAAAADPKLDQHDLDSDSEDYDEDDFGLLPVDPLHPEQPADGNAAVLQPPKRKGGRKPIYATTEERKQRNRQAQAAFRERRTEYIKQLEITLKQHEQLIQTVQHDHSVAANDRTALQYKLSVLETIMREKGINVEAELRAKGIQTHPLPQPVPSSTDMQSNHSRMSPRYQTHRGANGAPSKLDLKTKLAKVQQKNIPPLPETPQSQAPPWQYSSPASPLVMSPNAHNPTSIPSPYFPPGPAHRQPHGASSFHSVTQPQSDPGTVASPPLAPPYPFSAPHGVRQTPQMSSAHEVGDALGFSLLQDPLENYGNAASLGKLTPSSTFPFDRTMFVLD